jgi:hypothetical protein
MCPTKLRQGEEHVASCHCGIVVRQALLPDMPNFAAWVAIWHVTCVYLD